MMLPYWFVGLLQAALISPNKSVGYLVPYMNRINNLDSIQTTFPYLKEN